LRFDLSPVPASATIQQATLTLYTFWMGEVPYDSFSATRITSDWDAETVESEFPTFDDEAYEVAMTEYEAVFDVTPTIEEIVEFGEPNYGFMLYFVEGEPLHELGVLSCDYEDPSGRPYLTITYTQPS